MSILSRMFGGKKPKDPLAQIEARIAEEEADGMFIGGGERPVPASVAQGAPAPGDEEDISAIAEDVLPTRPTMDIAQDVESAGDDGEPEAVPEAADPPEASADVPAGPEVEDEPEGDAEEKAPPTEEGGETPVTETKTVSGGGEDDALSMFRAAAGTSEITGLTQDIEDVAADDLLSDLEDVRGLLMPDPKSDAA